MVTGQQIVKPNGLLFIDQEFIMHNLPNSRPCEVCELPLEDHKWVELGEGGFVERCSFLDYIASEDA